MAFSEQSSPLTTCRIMFIHLSSGATLLISGTTQKDSCPQIQVRGKKVGTVTDVMMQFDADHHPKSRHGWLGHTRLRH